MSPLLDLKRSVMKLGSLSRRFKINDEKEKMMKNVKIFAIALTLVAMASSSAMAFTTGQINIPSTDAKGLKEVTIGINDYAKFSSDNPGTVYGLGLTTGLLPFEKVKAEVGTDYVPGAVYPFKFNAKLATTEDAIFSGMPALAVGAFEVSTIDAFNTPNIMYGLVAKTLPVIGRLSIGGYSGDKGSLVDINGKKENVGILASWDRSMPEISDKLWLAVDYMSGKNSYGGIGIGGSWAFSKQISVLAGVSIYNEDDPALGGKPSLTTQVIINLP